MPIFEENEKWQALTEKERESCFEEYIKQLFERNIEVKRRQVKKNFDRLESDLTSSGLITLETR